MGITKFRRIWRNLHFCSPENEDPEDPIGKIRSFVDALNEAFLKARKPMQDLSIDEIMIPFVGRWKHKQHMKSKVQHEYVKL